MFVRTRDFDHEMAELRADLKMLSEKYWKLYHKHERLMTHLGLYEHERSGVEIRKKGGPERGEQDCNDDTSHSDLCEAIIDSKEADLGQDLDPFWKWAFRRGFHEAETSYKVDIATLEQQRDELLSAIAKESAERDAVNTIAKMQSAILTRTGDELADCRVEIAALKAERDTRIAQLERQRDELLAAIEKMLDALVISVPMAFAAAIQNMDIEDDDAEEIHAIGAALAEEIPDDGRTVRETLRFLTTALSIAQSTIARAKGEQ